MTMPEASIIVPAFNVAATLQATLASLQAQTHGDFEIIIVLDGPRDETPRLAYEAAASDPRIRVIAQQNRGLAGARNTGIQAAKGAYIGFCDADDLWLPHKLSTHVDHLAANPNVGISYSASAFIDDSGSLTGLAMRPRLTEITAAHVFRRNPIGNGSAPVIRRAVFDAIAWRPDHEAERDWCFDETFRQSEDIECWLRIALTTDWAFEGVPEALTLYRVSAGALSADTTRQFAAWERMVTKLEPLAPGFFAAQTPAARAYQLRYLARRAVADRRRDDAWRLAVRSLRQSLTPLMDEPRKTMTTLAAALALRLAGPRLIDRAFALLSHSVRKA
jgi:hypothetical protein